ncbi:hypothetical protein L682_04290 [Aquipseudomonas alcaligenes OT 69]|nr:hypothetical protein L682_04290 [Pseudomonas alcaligenes OT 69]
MIMMVTAIMIMAMRGMTMLPLSQKGTYGAFASYSS